MRRCGAYKERGAATILACCVMAMLVALAATLLHVGSVVAARHRAQAAADLAALAVATALGQGTESSCGAAEPIVSRMRAETVSCTVEGWDAVVTVTAPVFLTTIGMRDARAVARAGPAE